MKTTPKNPHIHTQPTHSETCLYKTTYCYSTYQHKAITSRSRQHLMMGTWLPETCSATIRREIKNTKVTSSWFFLSTLYFIFSGYRNLLYSFFFIHKRCTLVSRDSTVFVCGMSLISAKSHAVTELLKLMDSQLNKFSLLDTGIFRIYMFL